MRMPASVAKSVPAAMAPRVPRKSRCTGRSWLLCCPQPAAASRTDNTTSFDPINYCSIVRSANMLMPVTLCPAISLWIEWHDFGGDCHSARQGQTNQQTFLNCQLGTQRWTLRAPLLSLFSREKTNLICKNELQPFPTRRNPSENWTRLSPRVLEKTNSRLTPHGVTPSGNRGAAGAAGPRKNELSPHPTRRNPSENPGAAGAAGPRKNELWGSPSAHYPRTVALGRSRILGRNNPVRPPERIAGAVGFSTAKLLVRLEWALAKTNYPPTPASRAEAPGLSEAKLTGYAGAGLTGMTRKADGVR